MIDTDIVDAGLISTSNRVRLITACGDIVIALRPDLAPHSVDAFLEEVRNGSYDGGAFPRVVHANNDSASPSIAVIQASIAPGIAHRADVPHESTDQTGLAHEDGAVALPRQDGSDTGTAQGIFICIGRQAALDAGGERTADRRGFAVIGRVVEGMDVVRAIHRTETREDAPQEIFRGQIPIAPPAIYLARTEPWIASYLLDNLADDYWAFRVREFPTEASAAGIKSENRRLDGAREEDYARRARLAGVMLNRAHDIDASELDEDGMVTFDLLTGQLRSILDAYALREHRRPRLFPFGFFDVPDLLAQMTALDTLSDRDDFAARMRAVPSFLQDNLDILLAGFEDGYRISRVLILRILALLDAYLSDEGLRKRIAARLEPGIVGAPLDRLAQQRDEIGEIVDDRILPVLREVREFFSSLGDEAITDTIGLHAQPDGRAYYRYKVHQQTSLDLDPGDVHQMGIDEVARIGIELDAVLTEMGRPGERLSVAAELDGRQATDADALLLRVRAFAKQVDGLLPRLFGRMPGITYAVEPLSKAASAALPPALAQPAPADRSMPGIFMLTALPEKCPLHLIVPLTLHEAWPGHLMQFAIAHEVQDLPAFRRYGWAEYNGYVEGWALYCERLGHDLRLYDDPADRFGMLTFDLWRAVRLVVDTGIHWLGWSRDQAIDYMKTNTFLPETTIESEVDRYIGMPAQALSYKVGERTISALRAEAEQELQEAFSLRDFHDAILAMGPVSLSAMRDQVSRWIAKRRAP